MGLAHARCGWNKAVVALANAAQKCYLPNKLIFSPKNDENMAKMCLQNSTEQSPTF